MRSELDSRSFASAWILLFALAALAPSAAHASPPAPRRRRIRRPALFKDSRQSLAIAGAQGRTQSCSVLLVARPGHPARWRRS